MATGPKSAPNWVTFTGLLFLIIGIFFSLKTLANFVISPSYPISASTGISSLMGFSSSSFGESACQGDQQCLNSVKEARSNAMVSDVTNSLFFLFVGSGILYTRKRFYY